MLGAGTTMFPPSTVYIRALPVMARIGLGAIPHLAPPTAASPTEQGTAL